MQTTKRRTEMSDKITKSPQIRFAGFTDAWEQRTFSELVNRVSKSSEVDELPRVEYEDIVSGQGELNKDIFAKESDKKGIEFEFGDTLFGKLRPYLQNWLLADFKGIAVGDWWVLRPNEMDSKFIYSLIQSSKYQIVANLSTGSKMPRSDWNVVSQTEFSVPPDKGEQAKIGQLFNQLNHLLTLHQRELGLLKDTKKSLLQKMFPKDGANVPEIRFAGFTDAWESRRLGDYANFRRGSFPQPYGNKDWYDGDGAMPFVQVVDVTDHLVLVDDTKQKISKLAQPKSVFVPKGKVLVTLQGSIGRVAITQYDSFVDRTLLIFEGYERPTDEHFWAYIIQKKFEIEKNKAPGGTIKTITKEALSSFEVLLPEYKEQRQIGTFFNQLDNLIILHQRELNSLKNMKKSLLQQMFI